MFLIACELSWMSRIQTVSFDGTVNKKELQLQLLGLPTRDCHHTCFHDRGCHNFHQTDRDTLCCGGPTSQNMLLILTPMYSICTNIWSALYMASMSLGQIYCGAIETPYFHIAISKQSWKQINCQGCVTAEKYFLEESLTRTVKYLCTGVEQNFLTLCEPYSKTGTQDFII